MSGADLPALIGSRICHDLVNPLSAIRNGVELLQLSGMEDSPELALVAEAVEGAARRIRLFRIAFGAAAPGQMVAEREIRDLLAPDPGGRRLAVDWRPAGDRPRELVKAALLVVLGCESAMPWGGAIRIEEEAGRWRVTGEAERMRDLTGLWRLVDGSGNGADPAPAEVHFALIAPALARQGRRAVLNLEAQRVRVDF